MILQKMQSGIDALGLRRLKGRHVMMFSSSVPSGEATELGRDESVGAREEGGARPADVR